eukprot:6862656-Prymnesium_polylepis.2
MPPSAVSHRSHRSHRSHSSDRHVRLLCHLWRTHDEGGTPPLLAASDDIIHIHVNGFKSFTDDCKLVVAGSKHCGSSSLDQLFVMVNTVRRPPAQMDEASNP